MVSVPACVEWLIGTHLGLDWPCLHWFMICVDLSFGESRLAILVELLREWSRFELLWNSFIGTRQAWIAYFALVHDSVDSELQFFLLNCFKNDLGSIIWIRSFGSRSGLDWSCLYWCYDSVSFGLHFFPLDRFRNDLAESLCGFGSLWPRQAWTDLVCIDSWFREFDLQFSPLSCSRNHIGSSLYGILVLFLWVRLHPFRLELALFALVHDSGSSGLQFFSLDRFRNGSIESLCGIRFVGTPRIRIFMFCIGSWFGECWIAIPLVAFFRNELVRTSNSSFFFSFFSFSFFILVFGFFFFFCFFFFRFFLLFLFFSSFFFWTSSLDCLQCLVLALNDVGASCSIWVRGIVFGLIQLELVISFLVMLVASWSIGSCCCISRMTRFLLNLFWCFWCIVWLAVVSMLNPLDVVWFDWVGEWSIWFPSNPFMSALHQIPNFVFLSTGPPGLLSPLPYHQAAFRASAFWMSSHPWLSRNLSLPRR